MKKNQSKSSYLKAEIYTAPDIEILEIEIEQNILAGGSGDLPGMPGKGW